MVAGVPAFDEEQAIARVVLLAQRYVSAVVVCDDGSGDLTGEVAERLGAVVVRHERNLGYGAALRSLFGKARELGADVLVTLDADGQHDPCEIPLVVAPVLEGRADIVIGSRFLGGAGGGEMPSHRRFGARVITLLVNGAVKGEVTDAQSGFRAYSRRALASLDVTERGMGASVELLVQSRSNSLRVCEVPISCRYASVSAKPSQHPLRHGLGVVMSLVKFIVEGRPLLFLGVPGLLFLFVGFGFGVWMLQLYAAEHQIMTSLAIAALGFGLFGLFLLMTGILLYAISLLAAKVNLR